MVTRKFVALLVSLLFLGVAAFAEPIVISDFHIEKTATDYVVVLKLVNSNVSAGEYTDLSFYIPELGTTKDMGVQKVETEKILTYSLKEVTDNYDLLEAGKTYTLEAKVDDDSKEETFLYGSEPSEGSEGLGIAMQKVEINGVDVTSLDELQVMNGDNLNVKLSFTATQNFDDARLMIMIEGYEHSPIVASTPVFSVREGVTYVKDLEVSLPADMDSEREYKLRILGANDLSGLTYKEYILYVDTERNRVDILDLITTPSSGIEPGQNVVANVRIKNRGQKNQESVKITVSIPDLGVTESSYVSSLEKGEAVTSDDMLLFIPEDAKPGTYPVIVTLTYNDGHTETKGEYQITVAAPKVETEKALLVSYKDNINLKEGVTKSISVIVANPNKDSKAISVVPSGVAWADVEVEPTLSMIKGGEDAVFTIKITPKAGVSGDKELHLLVKEENKIVKELSISTYVEPATTTIWTWTNIVLAALLIIAIIIILSLIAAIVKRSVGEESEDNSEEEYY